MHTDIYPEKFRVVHVFFLNRVLYAITMPIRTVFNWLARFPALRKVPELSLAALVALITFFFLLIVVIFAAVGYYFAGDEVDDKDWWQWPLAVMMTIAISAVVYQLIRICMLKVDSRFREIDDIWESAMEQCEQNAIHLAQIPVFLVLGGSALNKAREIMAATKIQHSVAVPSKGKGDIGVFADSSAIFVFVPGCSCVSRLSSAPTMPAGISSSKHRIPDSNVDATMDASRFSEFADEENTDLERTLDTELPFSAESDDLPSAGDMARIEDTMPLPDDELFGDSEPHGLGTSSFPVRQLASKEVFECEQKLRHVCGLISKARGALCPVNGLLTLLPFELIEAASGEVQTAVQRDLAVLREELQVRCQNIVLVTQLESIEGFEELVGRVGEIRARDFRFGKGGTLWAAPKTERLKAIATHAVGAFEDWIYALFQQEDSYDNPNNSKLFMLLARTRGKFSENLAKVLAGGFANDALHDGDLESEQFLFGGCYFAATGTGKFRQAFVKSVFAKAIREEGELEWSPKALRREQGLQLAASLFALLGLISIVAIVVMLMYKFELQELIKA